MECCGKKLKKDWAFCPRCGKGQPIIIEAEIVDLEYISPEIEFGVVKDEIHKIVISMKHGQMEIPFKCKPGKKRITIEDI